MAATSSNHASDKMAKPIAVTLLLIAFVMPFYFFLGGLKLSGHRTILIIFLFPAIFGWLSGRAGKLRAIDFLIIGFAFWAALSMAINHGLATRWQFIGMLMIETLAPYFIARTYIRNLAAFRHFAWWFFVIICALLPFALFELFTDKSLLLDLLGKVLPVYQDWNYEPRLGLERAQATMPHPILFGVFCSSAFSLTWYVLGWERSFFQRVKPTSLVGVAVFASLSSGAWMNVIIQVALMAWNRIFQFLKGKWKVLLSCFGTMYVILELGANRNAFQIFATHLTLTPGTAWARINTFIFASDDVLDNPFFGIGLHDWTRPDWVLASVDNFWLVIALRHGFPGLILLVIPVFVMFFQVGGKPLTGAVADARLGYLFSLSGLCISAITVHLWDSTFCFFMFLLGAGVWFLDADEQEEDGRDVQPSAPDKKIQYTRFPKESPGMSTRSL